MVTCFIGWLKWWISKKENKIWLVNIRILQGIYLFQAVAASKFDTLLSNLATDDQIIPNKRFSLFLFSQTFPIMYFLVSMYILITSTLKFLWFYGSVWSGCQLYYFLYKKLWTENNKILVLTHASKYSRSEIINQSHSTNLFKNIGD